MITEAQRDRALVNFLLDTMSCEELAYAVERAKARLDVITAQLEQNGTLFFPEEEALEYLVMESEDTLHDCEQRKLVGEDR